MDHPGPSMTENKRMMKTKIKCLKKGGQRRAGVATAVVVVAAPQTAFANKNAVTFMITDQSLTTIFGERRKGKDTNA